MKKHASIASIVFLGSTAVAATLLVPQSVDAALEHQHDACGQANLTVFHWANGQMTRAAVLGPGDASPYIAFDPNGDYVSRSTEITHDGYRVVWYCGNDVLNTFSPTGYSHVGTPRYPDDRIDLDVTMCGPLYGAAFQVVRHAGERGFDVYCLDKQSAKAHGVTVPDTGAAQQAVTAAPPVLPRLPLAAIQGNAGGAPVQAITTLATFQERCAATETVAVNHADATCTAGTNAIKAGQGATYKLNNLAYTWTCGNAAARAACPAGSTSVRLARNNARTVTFECLGAKAPASTGKPPATVMPAAR